MSCRAVSVATSPTSPGLVRNYMRAKLAVLEHEVLGVLLLDSRHGLIQHRISVLGRHTALAALYGARIHRARRVASFSNETHHRRACGLEPLANEYLVKRYLTKL